MLKFCTTENLTHEEGRGIFARKIKDLIAMRKYILVFLIALLLYLLDIKSHKNIAYLI